MQSSTAPSLMSSDFSPAGTELLISIPLLHSSSPHTAVKPVRRQPYRATVSLTELFLSHTAPPCHWFLVFLKVFSHLCTLNQPKWPFLILILCLFSHIFFNVCKKQTFRTWFELLRYICGPNHRFVLDFFVFFFAGFVWVSGVRLCFRALIFFNSNWVFYFIVTIY